MQRDETLDRTASGRRPTRSVAALFAKASTWVATLLVATAILNGCGAPAPPSNGGGVSTASATDPVRITSPVDGAVVSGATYFAVQVLDAAALSSLTLRVGGDVVTPTFPGETPLRVFLVPRDHPEGRLVLSASVTHAGQTFTARSEVDVVHEPPSSASVASRGAVLGGVESSGAVSTVSIPPGTAQGASVSFETLTQAEVLAQTGVDYDALGVTFLGAQEIRSSVPTGDRVSMTSGGFGPMVQPGQVVVSYRITPDLGRGVGELMVINRAGTAPSGDIVSAPWIEPQVSGVEVAAAGGVARASLAGRTSTTLPSGPPGTQLRFIVGGLNPYAVNGYAVRFRQGSSTVEVPALLGNVGDGRQYLLANVPDLNAGNATVDLYSVADEAAFMSFTMPITASPSVADPKTLIDAAYAAWLAEVDGAASAFASEGFDLDFGPLRAAIASARAFYAGLSAQDQELVAQARRLAGAGVSTSAASVSRSIDVRPLSGAMCLLEGRKYVFDKDFGARAFQGDRFETGMRTLGSSLTLDFLDRFADRLEGTEYDCDPLKEQLCEAGIGPGCGNDDDVIYPDDDLPNSPLPRPRPFPNPGGDGIWQTGMGSLFPPGGPLAGSAGGGGGVGGSSSSRTDVVERRAVQRIEPGRYSVRIVPAGGGAWPFATQIGSDGYFFIPALPDGVPVTVVVSDRVTFAECTFPITGRSRFSASAVYVDLDACVGPDAGDYTIVYKRPPAGVQGNWHNPQHWDPPRVPTPDDDVLIPSLADTVFVRDQAAHARSVRSVGTLTLVNRDLNVTGDLHVGMLYIGSGTPVVSVGGAFDLDGIRLSSTFTLPPQVTSIETVELLLGGRLVVDHTLTVTNSLLINHGWLRGSGRTILAENAVGELRGTPGQFGGGAIADSHTLEVRDRFWWSTVDGGLGFVDDGSVEVTASGLLHLAQHNSGFRALQGGENPMVVNYGRILADATGTNNFEAPLTNHGTVEVAAGTVLRLTHWTARVDNFGVMTGGGTIRSERLTVGQPFVHHAGAVLDVDSLVLQTTPDGATASIEGQLGVRNLELQLGRFTLDQDLTLDRLLIHDTATLGATLISSGAITVHDELWIGGGTLGGTGTTTLLSGGELHLLRNRTRVITDSHTLINQGVGTWSPNTGGTRVTIHADATFRNEGTFVVQNDQIVDGGGTFVNAGTVRKEIATGTSNWTAVCYQADAGAELQLDSGDISLTTGC